MPSGEFIKHLETKFDPVVPESFEADEPRVTYVAKKIRKDLNLSYGNSMIHSFEEVCRDVTCNCPSCKGDALRRQDWDQLPTLPNKEQAREFLKSLEGKEIPIFEAKEVEK